MLAPSKAEENNLYYKKGNILVENKKDNFCCTRFKEYVDEGQIVHSFDDIDETEWYVPKWAHIYYCPFCGAYIKGKGYGKPPKSNKKRKKE